jgi:glucokinase
MKPMNEAEGRAWNLVADVGGTNARFGVEDAGSGDLRHVRYFSVAQYSAFGDAVAEFVREVAIETDYGSRPKGACVAVACPVENEVLRFTNSPWTIDRERLSQILNGAKIDLINDFTAVGHAIPDLAREDLQQVGGAEPEARRAMAVLGPGTGLGVCAVIPCGSSYSVVEGEGGHVDFAATSARQIAVLDILAQRFGRVSVERLLSGAGIRNIYQALAEVDGLPQHFDSPEQITRAGASGEDPLSMQALNLFCHVLGATAGNLALTLGARGGVYVAGGIVTHFIDFLRASEFRAAFEDKGRFKSYLAEIPVYVIDRPNLGLLGAARKLREAS